MIQKRHKKYNKLKVKKKVNKNKSIYEIGLGFLRIYLSFTVVVGHCNSNKSKLILWLHKKGFLLYHVRTFTIMSFYFLYNTLSSLNRKKIFQRFIRLFVPYILWPIIIFYLNNYILNKFIKIEYKYKYRHLIEQILKGSKMMPILWYQYNLIFITFLFVLIIFIFRKHHKFVLALLAIKALDFQYTGKNWKYFSKLKSPDTYTYGRLLEIIPFSVIGYLIASYNIINFIKNNKLKTIIVCGYSIYFLTNNNIFVNNRGFIYNGLKFYFETICAFFIFFSFPSEKIKNKTVIKIIKIITSHTGGVYYLHLTVYSYFKNYIKPIGKGTTKGSVIIYLICYIICKKKKIIFGKTILRNLFE